MFSKSIIVNSDWRRSQKKLNERDGDGETGLGASPASHDMSFSPQTNRCLWARYAPVSAIQNSQEQIMKDATNIERM